MHIVVVSIIVVVSVIVVSVIVVVSVFPKTLNLVRFIFFDEVLGSYFLLYFLFSYALR